MGNIVALTNLKKMRETENQKMAILSEKIWEILISKQLLITFEYLPAHSTKWRTWKIVTKDSSEWVLCRHVFCNLCLDLFASKVSQKVARYAT